MAFKDILDVVTSATGQLTDQQKTDLRARLTARKQELQRASEAIDRALAALGPGPKTGAD